jgi:aryl-alcohol dehydrogenase-like predicted oxidoreductase
MFGRTGLQVSVLGFGGAEIGYGHAPQATVDRLLGAALDAGLNVIDTAECYLDSETLIGRAVAHRRSEYYLLTKCGHASGLDRPDWDPRLLTASIERSLRRLSTDAVDVVQLHSCAADVLRRGGVIDVRPRLTAWPLPGEAVAAVRALCARIVSTDAERACGQAVTPLSCITPPDSRAPARAWNPTLPPEVVTSRSPGRRHSPRRPSVVGL